MRLRVLLGAILALATAALANEDYAKLLRRVVKEDGVDYPALKKDRATLDRYVKSLEDAEPGETDAEKIAFFVNAYNALTLQHVLDHWNGKPTFSVYHDVEDFWKRRKWKVAGRELSLDQIEHEVLRKEFTEPRIHFAVNCASRSCPDLIPELYDAKTLDDVLTRQARAFLADETRNRFDPVRLQASISQVFQWYAADFEVAGEPDVPQLQAYLAQYVPREKTRRALRRTTWKIVYLPYDWGLNIAGYEPETTSDSINPIWFVLYAIATGGLLFYGFHAFKLLRWRRTNGEAYRAELRAARAVSSLGRTIFPKVFVQVPVFNEAAVVERAVDAVARLDYPHEALEIEILDDSTDETVGIVRHAVEGWRARGVPIRVRRRSSRAGFKAGALAESLARSDAEYVAVFDADFVPWPDFLRRALPLFDAPGRVACVQGRWEHLNRDQNWLTRAQAVGVDAHFHIQQLARAARGAFLNFNGTAGIWRRDAIEDAGGWRADTLTEDLDLSYRAQLLGWRIVFDEDLAVPAELPPTLGAFKSQQRRWACGSMQCARRFLGPVWRSRLPFRTKAEATIHLCGYGVCLAMMLLVCLLPLGAGHLPVLAAYRGAWPAWLAIWWAALGPIVVSVVGQRARGRVRKRDIASCFLLGLGACANNALAVLRGLSLPIRTFVRTPKQGKLKALRTPMPVLEQVMTVFSLGSVAVLALTAPIAVATYALFCSAGFCSLAGYWWLVERRNRA